MKKKEIPEEENAILEESEATTEPPETETSEITTTETETAEHIAQPKPSKPAKRVPRYSKKTRILLSVLSSIVAIVGCVCILIASYGMYYLSKINYDSGGEEYDPNIDISEPSEEEQTTYTDPFDDSIYDNAASLYDIPLRSSENGIRNILLIGIDGNTFSGRSDTMMLLSINDNTKTIKLISFLRDTWVTIPGRDKDGDGKDDYCKLNTAYAYGRFPLLKKTMAQNFRLDIDEYIGVNFKVLPNIVDAMGGLEVSLTAKEMAKIPAAGCTETAHSNSPNFVPLSGKPGVHLLNGFQTLEYARLRSIDNDFKRTERQRKVVNLLIQKAKTMTYDQLLAVLDTALGQVSTNMSADEFIMFAANAVTYSDYKVEMDRRIPADDQYKGTFINRGHGLQLLDPKDTVIKLHNYIYDY